MDDEGEKRDYTVSEALDLYRVRLRAYRAAQREESEAETMHNIWRSNAMIASQEMGDARVLLHKAIARETE